MFMKDNNLNIIKNDIISYLIKYTVKRSHLKLYLKNKYKELNTEYVVKDMISLNILEVDKNNVIKPNIIILRRNKLSKII